MIESSIKAITSTITRYCERGSVRSLGKQVDLLSDGLHAVRNQSYSVTEEFIERALESLSKELRQLNEGEV